MTSVSTCKPGEEKYEEFWSDILKKYMVQYEYRSFEGKLFTCVAPNLDIARHRCYKWLQEPQYDYIHLV